MTAHPSKSTHSGAAGFVDTFVLPILTGLLSGGVTVLALAILFFGMTEGDLTIFPALLMAFFLGMLFSLILMHLIDWLMKK